MSNMTIKKQIKEYIQTDINKLKIKNRKEKSKIELTWRSPLRK
jgi:hypothetical protein